jgi:GNAT superfamily N-acetyltransferase
MSPMSNTVYLRGAIATDEAFVLRLEELALRKPIERAGGWFVPRPGMGDDFPENCRIIRSEGQDVGCLTLTIENSCVVVDQFYILPEFRGRGLGRRVLSYVLSDAALRCRRVKTSVLAVSEILGFFTDQGFAVVSQSSKSAALEWPGPTKHSNISRNINA